MQKREPSYTGCDDEPIVNAPPGNHTSTGRRAAERDAGANTFNVRHACSSVAPRNDPGTSPSSGPPIGCGAAGPYAVALSAPDHDVTRVGGSKRPAVAYGMPRNTFTARPS